MDSQYQTRLAWSWCYSIIYHVCHIGLDIDIVLSGGYYTRVLRWAFQCKRSNVWETGYRTRASHWYSVIHETNQKRNLVHWMLWLHYSRLRGLGAWGNVYFVKRVQSLKTTPLFFPLFLTVSPSRSRSLSLSCLPTLLTALSLSSYSSLCFSFVSLSIKFFLPFSHPLTSPISIWSRLSKGVIPSDLRGVVF